MRFLFSKIYIIESLPHNERRTGKELFDDIVRRMSELKGINSEYFNIKSLIDLNLCLTSIKSDVFNVGHYPFIHFETHGYEGGIAINSEENELMDVLWSDLKERLLRINVGCNNNLYVAVAACNGGSIQNIIDITEPSHVYGFIGPQDLIGDRDLLSSYTEFYLALLNKEDMAEAINILNRTSSVPFSFANCEQLFELALNDWDQGDDYSELATHIWNNPTMNSSFQSEIDVRKWLLHNDPKSNSSNVNDTILMNMKKTFLHR